MQIVAGSFSFSVCGVFLTIFATICPGRKTGRIVFTIPSQHKSQFAVTHRMPYKSFCGGSPVIAGQNWLAVTDLRSQRALYDISAVTANCGITEWAVSAKVILQKMRWKSVERGRTHMTGLKCRCHSWYHGIDRSQKGTSRNHFGEQSIQLHRSLSLVCRSNT